MKVLSNSKSTIIQINDDAIEVSNDKKSMNGRVFAYTLNEKRAKRNLLKGAEKENPILLKLKPRKQMRVMTILILTFSKQTKPLS